MLSILTSPKFCDMVQSYEYCHLTLYTTVLTFNDTEKDSLRKKMWEKEKMPVTSICIFSFYQTVFFYAKD